MTLVLSCILAPTDQLLWVIALSHSLCWTLASPFYIQLSTARLSIYPVHNFRPSNELALTSTHVNTCRCDANQSLHYRVLSKAATTTNSCIGQTFDFENTRTIVWR